VEPRAIHAPEKTIVGVAPGESGLVSGGLLIDGAGDDQFVQLFERTAVVEKPGGEPVEEFRVGWAAAHLAQIVRGVNQAPTEVVVPDPIDDGAPGERVLR